MNSHRFLFLLFCSVPALAMATQPNIVFIMADDMGIAELGVTGQLERAANGLPSIDTPNLDTLAVNGLLMNNFYATPICASTRSAVMSGFHNGHSSVDRNGGNNGGNAIRSVDVTMAEMLKSVGYTTAGYGKWGLGGYDHTVTGGGVGNISTAAITHPQAIPTVHGFDEWYGYLNQVHAHDYYIDFLWEQDGSGGLQIAPTSSSDYSHDLMADRNLQFISDNADATGENPFFVYGAYTIPHAQFNPPNDAIRQDYISRGYSSSQANYAAMITRLDNSVGDIVDRLQDPNEDGDPSDSVYDNTLIIFTSDNGGTGGENALFGGDGGLRGTKGSVHEGGTRSPFIAHWNGTIAASQTDDTNIASLDDLFATFGELAGADQPVGMDSASFAGLFTGDAIEDRASHVFEARVAGDWAIRIDRWKLSKSGSNTLGLYDLAVDNDESNNLLNNPSSQQQAIANLLQQMALDEGVESDAGGSSTQTTHIVQYKTWAPQGTSEQWESTSNWSGGTSVNTRGTPVNNFNTAPANNWIATVDNLTGGERTTVVPANSEVLGLQVRGTAGPMTVAVDSGATLTTRNGSLIEDGGIIHLDGGNLHTMRTIDIRQGGMLSGAGVIETGYDTSGTPIVLESRVQNAGLVDISNSTSGTAFIDIAKNGGFEFGTGNPFDQTDDWTNFGSDQTLNARNTSNPASGAFRGIVGRSGGNSPVSPAQSTGHILELGDELTIDLKFAGASGWDLGSDRISMSLAYDDNGTPVNLFSTTLNPSQHFGSGYDGFFNALPAITDPAAVGHELLVRFESLGSASEFAAIDEFRLSIATSVPGQSILTIDGDFVQLPDGTIAFDLLGLGTIAGVDFDQLVVTDTAELAGTIELAVEPGIELTPYQSVELIQSDGGLAGTFDSVDGAIQGDRALAVTYSANAVEVQLALIGDANLDGSVDTADFDIWNAHRFQAGTWATADFNGDGFTDVSDLHLWNDNKFTSVTTAVPEPSTLCGALFLAAILLGYRPIHFLGVR